MTTPTFRVVGFMAPCMPIVVELAEPVETLELRELLTSILRRVHPRVYYQEAPEGAEYPYIVFNLPNYIDQGTLKTYVLDVDVWDVPNHNDTTHIEFFMNIVNSALDHYTGKTKSGMPLVIYHDRLIPLDEDDKRIVRRKAIYEVRTFKKRRGYHG